MRRERAGNLRATERASSSSFQPQDQLSPFLTFESLPNTPRNQVQQYEKKESIFFFPFCRERSAVSRCELLLSFLPSPFLPNHDDEQTMANPNLTPQKVSFYSFFFLSRELVLTSSSTLSGPRTMPNPRSSFELTLHSFPLFRAEAHPSLSPPLLTASHRDPAPCHQSHRFGRRRERRSSPCLLDLQNSARGELDDLSCLRSCLLPLLHRRLSSC